MVREEFSNSYKNPARPAANVDPRSFTFTSKEYQPNSHESLIMGQKTGLVIGGFTIVAGGSIALGYGGYRLMKKVKAKSREGRVSDTLSYP